MVAASAGLPSPQSTLAAYPLAVPPERMPRAKSLSTLEVAVRPALGLNVSAFASDPLPSVSSSISASETVAPPAVTRRRNCWKAPGLAILNGTVWLRLAKVRPERASTSVQVAPSLLPSSVHAEASASAVAPEVIV